MLTIKLSKIYRLLLLSVFFPMGSLACESTDIVSSKTNEVNGQDMNASSTKSESKEFRFEDYTISETFKVQERMNQMFPIGSEFDLFVKKMETLGAEDRGSDPSTPPNQVFYYYNSGSGLVKTVWIVGANFDEERKIKEITVKSGAVGP